MIKNILTLLSISSFLFGCASGHEYSEYAQAIDSSNRSGQQTLTAYFNKKAVENQNIFKALTNDYVDPEKSANNQMAIMLYTLLSQQQDEKILAQFTPKTPERPTTNADIGMNLAGNFLPTLVKWGAGAYLGGEIVNGLQTGTVLSGGSMLINQDAGQSISGGPSISTSSSTATDSYNPAGNNNINSTLEENALPQ